MRSLITWVGGPEGHVNTNRGVAATSERSIAGLMRMPVGNRQAGVHAHSITEIYVILRGEVESFDGVGNIHRAGPLDCIYIPAGVPHGVRTVGDEDLELIWLHDAIEREGVSRYLEGSGPFPAEDEVSLIPLSDLEPVWCDKGVGHLFWSARWVTGPGGGPLPAVRNELMDLGLTVVSPWNAIPPEQAATDMTYIILRGHGMAVLDGVRNPVSPLDAIRCPAGSTLSIRGIGDQPLYLLWSSDLA